MGMPSRTHFSCQLLWPHDVFQYHSVIQNSKAESRLTRKEYCNNCVCLIHKTEEGWEEPDTVTLALHVSLCFPFLLPLYPIPYNFPQKDF